MQVKVNVCITNGCYQPLWRNENFCWKCWEMDNKWKSILCIQNGHHCQFLKSCVFSVEWWEVQVKIKFWLPDWPHLVIYFRPILFARPSGLQWRKLVLLTWRSCLEWRNLVLFTWRSCEQDRIWYCWPDRHENSDYSRLDGPWGEFLKGNCQQAYIRV